MLRSRSGNFSFPIVVSLSKPPSGVKAQLRAIVLTGLRPITKLQSAPTGLYLPPETHSHGFGRLIRSLEDRGVLVLLDPRIRRQRYGQTFLASPPYRVTAAIEDVEEFFGRETDRASGE